ncbi:hypothetical protein PX52LOC_01035 [Limnoglobus roseus]|uniref:Uncharacterized protein n=1 Tax=Limnoglobus roseus TaxID=2598579 RepID=A0A5C1A6Y9_9BACT|nr:hypothetical protein PX52LOC_01035 [Limnoglobus roseus]
MWRPAFRAVARSFVLLSRLSTADAHRESAVTFVRELVAAGYFTADEAGAMLGEWVDENS